VFKAEFVEFADHFAFFVFDFDYDVVGFTPSISQDRSISHFVAVGLTTDIPLSLCEDFGLTPAFVTSIRGSIQKPEVKKKKRNAVV